MTDTRTERQIKAGNKWCSSSFYSSDKDYWGSLDHPTGMGKTYTAIKFCALPYIQQTQYSGKVDVLVPYNSLVPQWHKEIMNLVPRNLQSLFNVRTVQEAIANNLHVNTDLLIIDEIHEFYEDLQSNAETPFFHYVDGTMSTKNALLCLSATHKNEHKRHISTQMIVPIIDVITEQEALDNGWISKYITYNLKVVPTGKWKEKYDALTDTITDYTKKFYPGGYKSAMYCLSGWKSPDGEYIQGWVLAHQLAQKRVADLVNREGMSKEEASEIWNSGTVIGHAKNFSRAVNERKRMLYDNKWKVAKLVEIIDKFPDKKTMIFGESADFVFKAKTALKEAGHEKCDGYSSQMESRPYYDQKKKEWPLYKSGQRVGQRVIRSAAALKKLMVEDFNLNFLKQLIAAKSFDTGFDDKTVEMGIICSYTSNKNQNKQRTGRTTRIDPNEPDSIVVIVNLYIWGTKDEAWLKKAQANSTIRPIWIESVDEISFTRKIGAIL